MNFDMHQNVDKTENFLDFLTTRKSLKLVDNMYLGFPIIVVVHA